MNVPSLGRILTALVGIYAAQSVIGGLVFQAVPAVLRSEGRELGLIGLVALLMLPHALKFLWAPAVERLRLPSSGARRSRLIILGGQTLAILLVLALAPGTEPAWLFLVLAFATLVSATLDIACDAFAVEQLPARARSWGNLMQVGGGYLGMMIGGGLFLVLTARLGWQGAVFCLAVVLAALSLPLWLTNEPPGDAAAQGRHRPSLRHALGQAVMRQGLATVVVMQLGLRIATALLAPFLVDRGFGLEALGLLTGFAGTAASLLGTIAAAWVAARRPAGALLRPAVCAQALLFFALGAAALWTALPREAVAGIVLLLFFAMGASFVLLYTAMMGWAAGPQPGVDFTLLQCADAGVAALAGLGAGLLAQSLGYAPCFVLAAGLALLAVLVLPALRRTGAEAVA